MFELIYEFRAKIQLLRFSVATPYGADENLLMMCAT